jgi:hypothetical protein
MGRHQAAWTVKCFWGHKVLRPQKHNVFKEAEYWKTQSLGLQRHLLFQFQ